MNWTETQVDAIAPDTASLKAGKSLSIPSKWQNLGISEIALWGECQGSGSNPYKTQVDFRELAFKCSCPSRKFPCKHSIGILYLMIQKKELFNNQTPPAWVEEWLKSREEKKQKHEEKKEQKKEIDPDKKIKTDSKRMDIVLAGINELELWIKDLTRKGINSLQEESYGFFNNITSRMIDAKASGLAKKLEELSSIPNSGKNWAERFLDKLSSIYLLIQAFKKINTFDDELQSDIKTLIGWTYTKEEVLNNNIFVQGKWLVLSQSFEEERNLRTKKTYILNLETNKIDMLLDYAFGLQPFDNIDLLSGNTFEGEIVYFLATYKLRCLIKSKTDSLKTFVLSEKNGYNNIDQIYIEYTSSLALNPFIETIPILLRNVIPIYQDDELIIIDNQKHFIKVNPSFYKKWLILSLSGGKEINLFGEWDGNYFYPLSLLTNNEIVSLSGVYL